LSRIAALGIVIDMFVAYWAGDRASLLAFFSDPDKFSKRRPVYLSVRGSIILIFGPGKLSLDTLFDRLIRKRKYSESGEIGSSAV